MSENLTEAEVSAIEFARMHINKKIDFKKRLKKKLKSDPSAKKAEDYMKMIQACDDIIRQEEEIIEKIQN